MALAGCDLGNTSGTAADLMVAAPDATGPARDLSASTTDAGAPSDATVVPLPDASGTADGTVPVDATVTTPPDASMTTPPDASMTTPPDATMTTPRDATMTPPADATVILDASVIADATVIVDAPVPVADLSQPPGPDLSMIADLSMPGTCNNGYNASAPGTCPLTCGSGVATAADQSRWHIPYCTPISYLSNPPASGPHWPWPANWGMHAGIVPHEWWVHNLEHGGIVLLYNCPYDTDGGAQPINGVDESGCSGAADGGTNAMAVPNNCPNEIAQLQQLYSNGPIFNWGDALFEVKILVTADPLLPTRFAAVAWDWVWEGNTLDVPTVQCFINARYGNGPEVAP
jgi:hypothetical protein